MSDVKAFREIQAGDLASCSLRDEIGSRGYVLVRGVISREAVTELLREITEIVRAAGWLLPESDPLERLVDVKAACGDPDPLFKRVYNQIFSLEAFHRFAHHPALGEVMREIVGPELFVHPKPIARLIFPNREEFIVHAHQDHQSIGGDAESFTAWMPLHDCPAELGPLQVLERSHRFGLQKPDPVTGYVAREAALGDGWAGGEIRAGDVLIFHSLTVHAASPNLSKQLRVSLDCRFQSYERALNPSTLVFAGETDEKSWESTYAGWRSDDLKYFWKEMPLEFKPSKAELRELAQTADSPRMRSRYARILSRLG